MYYLAGDDVSLSLPFMVDGEYVVPDAGSVSYVVRDTAGAVVVTSTAVTTNGTQTSAIVVVPGAINTITGDLEKRSVDLQWKVAGAQYRAVTSYSLTGWLNHTVTAANVRAYIGLANDELADGDVDPVAAYFDVAEKLTKAVLDVELARTDIRTVRANRAIMLAAALAVMPSLQLRAAKSEQADTNIFERFPTVDFEDLASAASAELGEILRVIKVINPLPYSFVKMSSNADPVTS